MEIHVAKRSVYFRRTDVKYLIFIYSEQMTHSENENDHFDLDHLDHILAMGPAEKLMG